METNKIIKGDCIEVMKTMPDNSVDAIVTDPPYELGFMGKKWDASGIAYNKDLWKEALRVLKSGGHLLSFGGTRTYHRMAVAIEDAGFEIRDMLEWIYNTGFPKSHNVGKAFDKKMGNEREVVGKKVDVDGRVRANEDWAKEKKQGFNASLVSNNYETKGNSQWEGFGTALKPAHEPIVLARKPLSEKTIVENCIKWGTGALDIDGCKIPINKNDDVIAKNPHTASKGTDAYTQNCYGKYNPTKPTNYKDISENSGRFPANLLVTDDALNDGEIQVTRADYNYKFNKKKIKNANTFSGRGTYTPRNDKGSKSRYFNIDVWGEKYGLINIPKASKSERNKGCEELEEKVGGGMQGTADKSLKTGSGNERNNKMKNNHPTVKPIHLMSWLVRLVSKEGDVVLDPFMGSGTTAIACVKEGRRYIGIEQDEDYCKIAKNRIKFYESVPTLKKWV